MRLSGELAKVRSRALEAVVLDRVVPAVPEPDRVAAHADIEPLADDMVAGDARAIHLLEVDAEQHVFDHVVLDAMVVALEQDAGIDAVMRFTAAGDAQAAQGDAAGGDQEHGAASAADDAGPAATIQRQRPGDGDGPGMPTRRQAQRTTGRRGIDQCLQAGGGRHQRRQQASQENADPTDHVPPMVSGPPPEPDARRRISATKAMAPKFMTRA